VTGDARDLEFMELAVATARRSVSEGGEPRPKVGAVLSAGGELLDSAFRGESAAGEHAEFVLLEKNCRTRRPLDPRSIRR